MIRRAGREDAALAFRKGEALFREERFSEAVAELRRACDLYRHIDSLGHPFNITLENGVTGLANAHALLGRCHRAAGSVADAVASLEASLINARFERRASFRRFRADVERELVACYAQQVLTADEQVLARKLRDEPVVDIGHRFPFSLEPVLIPAARLYELAPADHAGYRAFYERARVIDAGMRRAESRTDDSTMRMISISVWSVLVLVWTAYGLVVMRALLGKK